MRREAKSGEDMEEGRLREGKGRWEKERPKGKSPDMGHEREGRYGEGQGRSTGCRAVILEEEGEGAEGIAQQQPRGTTVARGTGLMRRPQAAAIV